MNNYSIENEINSLFSFEEESEFNISNDIELTEDEQYIIGSDDSEELAENMGALEGDINTMTLALRTAEEFIFSQEGFSVSEAWKKFWNWIIEMFQKISIYIVSFIRRIQIWLAGDMKGISKWYNDNKYLIDNTSYDIFKYDNSSNNAYLDSYDPGKIIDLDNFFKYEDAIDASILRVRVEVLFSNNITSLTEEDVKNILDSDLFERIQNIKSIKEDLYILPISDYDKYIFGNIKPKDWLSEDSIKNIKRNLKSFDILIKECKKSILEAKKASSNSNESKKYLKDMVKKQFSVINKLTSVKLFLTIEKIRHTKVVFRFVKFCINNVPKKQSIYKKEREDRKKEEERLYQLEQLEQQEAEEKSAKLKDERDEKQRVIDIERFGNPTNMTAMQKHIWENELIFRKEASKLDDEYFNIKKPTPDDDERHAEGINRLKRLYKKSEKIFPNFKRNS